MITSISGKVKCKLLGFSRGLHFSEFLSNNCCTNNISIGLDCGPILCYECDSIYLYVRISS